MSGKSTYLRQVALLNVMAMSGCFVPAEYASFRLHDALLSRLSNDDSIEKSLSTFAAEMATSSMMLGLATDQSLVLMDELGRGTSPAEGLGICQAIAEEFIRRKVNSRSQVTAYNTQHSYRIVQGAVKLEHYGLELAKLANLPESVLEKSTEIAYKLEACQQRARAASESQAIAARRKALINLRSQLIVISENSTLDDHELRGYLRHIQQECIEELRKAIEARRAATLAMEVDVLHDETN
ncbi:hypothetical protein QFC22_000748 [Naganishia vaughanmartiniae]|uniref:Uncharacterized protein n=1 Tax=Naganishia vaughanmartiniae TaxID=1424756 RepID=A0ACC2XL12_9TREE|nr:hypothetical protein QFC22_000748 [Naganishia vaughanmartiniae]